MFRLLLLRHAKSDWANQNITDFARPLNERGVAAAPKMGNYIVENGLQPALVLCSTAARAQQTKNIVLGCFEKKPKTLNLDSLYNFSGFQNILTVIRNNGEKHSSVMLIGHNPTMQDLAIQLTGAGNAGARALLEQKYPTAGLAIIDFDIRRWKELQTDIGVMVNFIRPKDL